MATQFETNLAEALKKLPVNLPANVLTTTFGKAVDSAKADKATESTKATNDGSNRNIVNTYITKAGSRGDLAGNENAQVVSGNQTININSRDTIVIKTNGATTLTFQAAAEGINAVKEIALHANGTTTLTCNGAVWANKGEAPKWGTSGKNLVLIANFVGGRVVLTVGDNDE